MCPEDTDQYKTKFETDTDLTDFMKVGNLSLKTSAGQDESTLINICNPDRLINLVTLYMAKMLSLSIADIIDYTYDMDETYVYPNSTVDQVVYPPENLTDFPNLDQAYWTLVSQYTKSTEKNMR